MADDVLWSDISTWQVGVDDSYPYQVLAIRSNDGTYRDPKFAANYRWALNALATGKLSILIVYFVWRPNWLETVNTHKAMLGTPHDGVVSMVDIESWGGQITGNHSSVIDSTVANLALWYGNNTKRVIGYGNVGDLNTIWPTKPPGMRLIVAAYGSNPSYPGEIAHQFTNGVYDKLLVAPFGYADVNSADHTTLAQLRDELGLTMTTNAEDIADAVLHRIIPDMYPGANAKSVQDLIGWIDARSSQGAESAARTEKVALAILDKLNSISVKLDASLGELSVAIQTGTLRIELVVPPASITTGGK